MSTVEVERYYSQELIEESDNICDISIIVPIVERHDDLNDFYLQTLEALSSLERSIEFIFVVDGSKFNEAYRTLCEMKQRYEGIRIIRLNTSFGEATALAVGFENSRGHTIMTLSPYFQVEPREILKMIARFDDGADLVISRRYPRIDSVLNRVQSYIFHWLVRKLTGTQFHDLSCGMRVMTRDVFKEIDLYGDLHRFIPLLAWRVGFEVEEVEVTQSERDSGVRIVNFGTYIRRFLDIMTIFFLFKFTKKPLRFFGLIAVSLFLSGFSICFYLSFLKIIGAIALAGRPMLILGVLFMILGIQVGSIGLIGEIVIFTHAREINDYKIKEILE